MDAYDRLFHKVVDYASREPVLENDDVISAYTLWEAVQKESETFRYVLNDNGKLLDFVNFIYKEAYNSYPDSYELATMNLDVKLPLFKPLSFAKIESSYNDTTAKISLFPAGKKNESKRIDIYRDFSKDVYYGDNMNDYLLRNCKPIFDDMVDTLYFHSNVVSHCNCIKTEVFDIEMRHSKDEDVVLDIKFNLDIDPSNNQFRKFVGKLYTVQDVISSQKDVILKNTPIKIKNLSPQCRELYFRNKDKNKVLEKK